MTLDFAELATPGLLVLGSAVGALGTWILKLKGLSAHVEAEHQKTVTHMFDAEIAERSTFRAMMLRDVAEMRAIAKECEADRDALRTRLSLTEKNVMLLQANSEITDKWLEFLKENNALRFAVEYDLTKASVEALNARTERPVGDARPSPERRAAGTTADKPS